MPEVGSHRLAPQPALHRREALRGGGKGVPRWPAHSRGDSRTMGLSGPLWYSLMLTCGTRCTVPLAGATHMGDL